MSTKYMQVVEIASLRADVETLTGMIHDLLVFYSPIPAAGETLEEDKLCARALFVMERHGHHLGKSWLKKSTIEARDAMLDSEVTAPDGEEVGGE